MVTLLNLCTLGYFGWLQRVVAGRYHEELAVGTAGELELWLEDLRKYLNVVAVSITTAAFVVLFTLTIAPFYAAPAILVAVVTGPVWINYFILEPLAEKDAVIAVIEARGYRLP